MLRVKLVSLALLLATQVLVPQAAVAAAEAPEPKLSRQLNGHNFVRSELVAWPFPSTYFGSSFGVGLFSYDVPQGIDANGNAQALTITAAALTPRLDFGIGIADWIGVQLGVNGAVATGTNVDSALNFGAFFQAQFGGRVVGRLWRGDKLQVAAALGGEYSFGKLINPLLVVSELLSGGDFTASKLLLNVTSWNLGPEAMIAYAPLRLLGFQSSVAFRIGKTETGDNGSTTDKALAWAIGATFDLSSVVPLAVPIVYQLAVPIATEAGGDSRAQHFVEGGLVYSGRSNLDLGVLVSTQLKSDSKQYVGVFRMYYHW